SLTTFRISGQELFISLGLRSGPSTCCSRVSAGPSQNWRKLNATLKTVGALRSPSWPPTPTEYWVESAPPRSRLWQLAQEIERSWDRRLSRKSLRPSSTLR